MNNNEAVTVELVLPKLKKADLEWGGLIASSYEKALRRCCVLFMDDRRGADKTANQPSQEVVLCNSSGHCVGRLILLIPPGYGWRDISFFYNAVLCSVKQNRQPI